MRFMLHFYERRPNGSVHQILMMLGSDTEEEAKREAKTIYDNEFVLEAKLLEVHNSILLKRDE